MARSGRSPNQWLGLGASLRSMSPPPARGPVVEGPLPPPQVRRTIQDGPKDIRARSTEGLSSMEHRRPPTKFGSDDEERGVKEGTYDDRVRDVVDGGAVEYEEIVRAASFVIRLRIRCDPSSAGFGGSGPVVRDRQVLLCRRLTDRFCFELASKDGRRPFTFDALNSV